jgi:hypothetical protein
MGRAPCCEKEGLRRGAWSAEEDQRLVAYIRQHGHPNWRALPKQAGLLRCGKSCRLRWINYLRPDIKRGNFTADEEDLIIRLHQELGSRSFVFFSSCRPLSFAHDFFCVSKFIHSVAAWSMIRRMSSIRINFWCSFCAVSKKIHTLGNWWVLHCAANHFTETEQKTKAFFFKLFGTAFTIEWRP